MNDTIFALSSGHGKSGVAVIRISGKFHPSYFIRNPLKPRQATLVNLTDDNGELIDQIIAIYFPAPNSFTGEDVLEIHCHGGPAVIQKIFDFLGTDAFSPQSPVPSPKIRMAEPGEFSRRAFYNNKMDLTEIDGLAALLDARTDRQREFALKSMTGGDSKIYESWRTQMIQIAAYAAAILDYDENDLPKNIGEKLTGQTQKLYDEINNALSQSNTARRIQCGFNIVLVGETNVGKSSLFNRLVGSTRAIVSDIPGTTRDVISATLDIDGYLVNLSDTAGLRDSDDAIEKIGIEKTKDEIKNADLVLRVMDDGRRMMDDVKDNEIIVYNKSDTHKPSSVIHHPSSLNVSAATGAGIPELLELIKQKIHSIMDGTESDIAINARTMEQLVIARDELKKSLELRVESLDNGKLEQLSKILNNNQDLTHLNSKLSTLNSDMFSEHIKFASDAIGRILGLIDASEIISATFGQLCLGK